MGNRMIRGSVGPWLAAAVLVVASTAWADPKVTLTDNTARLPVGKGDGGVALLITVDGLDAAAVKQPADQLVKSATDLGMPSGPPTVTAAMSVSELSVGGASSRSFVLRTDVLGLPVNTAQPRFVKVTVLGKDWTLPYTLSNIGPDKFAWTMRPLTGQAISPGKPVSISVAVGPSAAHQVTVLQSGLLEHNIKTRIAASGLHVCLNATSECGRDERFDLAPGSAHELWLWGVTDIGRFEGSVTLAALEKPEGDQVVMTVYSSTLPRQVGGVIVIFASVVLTWFATAFLRNRLNRDQLLAPVSLAAETLTSLRERIDKDGLAASTSWVKAKLDAIEAALQTSRLEAHGLPARLPSFIGTNPSAASELKAYVQPALDWLAALQVIVVNGLDYLAHAPATLPGGNRALSREQAVSQVDALADADAAPPMETLIARLTAIRSQFDQLQAPASTSVATVAVALAPPIGSVRSAATLETRIERLSGLGWLFTSLATTLVGAYVLVFGPNATGFGTLLDYLVCAIWGIGLPAGTQLMSATAGSVSTTLNVPKS